MRFVEQVIDEDEAQVLSSTEGAGQALQTLLVELGPVKGQLRIRVETGDEAVPPMERTGFGIDYGGGREAVGCKCQCGFTTDTVAAMLVHVADHGAISLTVTPVNRAT